MTSSTRPDPWLPRKSAFAGFRFPPEVIVVAVRWYLCYYAELTDRLLLPAGRGGRRVPQSHGAQQIWTAIGSAPNGAAVPLGAAVIAEGAVATSTSGGGLG